MLAFLKEYALLIAVALPPCVIVVINVYLALTGERGTLLLPSSEPFPALPLDRLAEWVEATAISDDGKAEDDDDLTRRAA